MSASVSPQVIETTQPDPFGNTLYLRAFRATYATNGTPAIVLWASTPAGRLVSSEPWVTATVNGVFPPEPGLVALDVNAMGGGLTRDLLSSGHLTDTGYRAHSGYCTYPVAEVDEDWLASLTDVNDDAVMQRLLAERDHTWDRNEDEEYF